MTESEVKAVRFIENIKNHAMVTLDHIAKEEPNVSPLFYKGREEKANTILAMVEEVQKYRAIGTSEECRKSVDICKAMAERRLSLENIENYTKFEDECVKRGFTFNSLLEAREKQVPKKPTDRCMYKECPACGEVEIQFCKYCPSCGQKLDWGNE